MATDLAKLSIAVETGDLKKARKELNKLEGTGKKTESSLKKLPTIFTAIVASMAVREVVRYADAMTLVSSKLKLVTSSTSELVDVQKKLFDIAQASRVGYEDTVDLYSRMARSTQELGLTQEELLLVTDNISKSLIISGGSSESMNAALVQLGQGFASGTLRGEELNSVLEQTPRLARMISDGMGIAYGDLRKYAAEGKITSEALITAIKSQTEAVGGEFGQMTMTVSQSLTQVDNSFMVFIGTLNNVTGATDILSGAFSSLSGVLDDFNNKLQNSQKLSKKREEFALIKELENAGNEFLEFDKKKQIALKGGFGSAKLEEFIAKADEAQAKLANLTEEYTRLYSVIDGGKETKDTKSTSMTDGQEDSLSGMMGSAIKTGGTEDFMAEIQAKQDAEDQLQVNYVENLMIKTEALKESLLTEEELLNDKAENEVALAEEAFQVKLINEEERNSIMLELAARYETALTDMSTRGMSEREKFSKKSSTSQTKQILGDMASLTAGMATGNKTMFNINKAAALANAAISLPASVMKTYEAYPAPYSFIMGGLAAAAGAAQIATIASASYGGGGGGTTSSPTSGGGYSTTMGTVPSDIGSSASTEVQTVKEVTINMPEESTMSTDSVRELIERIQDESEDMGLSLVVAS